MSAEPPAGPAPAPAPLLSDAANAEHDRPAPPAGTAGATRDPLATRLLARGRTTAAVLVADGERLPAAATAAAAVSDPGAADDGAVATGRRKAAHGEVWYSLPRSEITSRAREAAPLVLLLLLLLAPKLPIILPGFNRNECLSCTLTAWCAAVGSGETNRRIGRQPVRDCRCATTAVL